MCQEQTAAPSETENRHPTNTHTAAGKAAVHRPNTAHLDLKRVLWHMSTSLNKPACLKADRYRGNYTYTYSGPAQTFAPLQNQFNHYGLIQTMK